MWATHAIGHIDRETKNAFIVTSGKKERGKDHPSQNDACEGKITDPLHWSSRKEPTCRGKKRAWHVKDKQSSSVLEGMHLGVHSRLFDYVRRKARQDLKKAGTTNGVWRRIAEDKVKCSEPNEARGV